MDRLSRHEVSPVVFVVGDDPGVRDAVALLMHSVGLESATHPSAQDFLATYDPERVGCLILDICRPGMDGLQLQEYLRNHGLTLPIILITTHDDVPPAVKPFNTGATDFLQKPFRDQELIDKVQSAIEQDRRMHQRTSA